MIHLVGVVEEKSMRIDVVDLFADRNFKCDAVPKVFELREGDSGFQRSAVERFEGNIATESHCKL